jgi:hypothetical protein
LSPRLARGASTALLAALLGAGAADAHVGSPDVVFDGTAGADLLRVVVRPPGVVPGRAQVLVRVLSGSAAAVTVQPVWWDAAREGGAPPPEPAPRVEGERGLFVGSVWLMTAGSYSVRVSVSGPGGGGEVLVPVAALATRRLAMPRGLGLVLAGLGGLLLAGAISVVGAAARESSLPEAAGLDRGRRRRGRIAMAMSAAVLAGALGGGWAWWGRVDTRFRRELYRPMPVVTRVLQDGGARLLRLSVAGDPGDRRRWTPLALDHGKVMHLFLVREPALDAFAHVHPIATSLAQDTFLASLPPIPPGRYRLYADVTHHDGLAQTLTDVVAVPEAGEGRPTSGIGPDPDDAGGTSAPLGVDASLDRGAADLGDGFAMTRLGGPLAARQETALEFAIRGRGGEAPALEPYMGMAGHALLTRDDGSVFIHLHPSGTVSMAAQAVFARQAGVESEHAGHAAHAAASRVSFPYEFPRAGRYRAWVQVRLSGRIRTGVFDLDVR